MPDDDECEYCTSSKRMRTSIKSPTNFNNNNNFVIVPHSYYDKVPSSVQQLADMPHLSYKFQLSHSWNPLDSSINIDVKLIDPLTLHRHPVAQSTDAIRGKIGYAHGLHMWRIDWKYRERGTHAVIGVCTKDAPLHCHGYCSLIGLTEESWGWDIIRRRLVHRQSTDVIDSPYPVKSVGDDVFEVPESLYVMLDMEQGTLAFATENEYLGVAFSDLKGKTLYPAVSAVWGHCEVTMVHMASMNVFPVSLLHLCRFNIRKHLRLSIAGNLLQTDEAVNNDLINKIDCLCIPEYLKQYLKTGSFYR